MFARKLIDRLDTLGVHFFSGVPDSILSALPAALTAPAASRRHVIAANEGGAVARAAGHSLATGETSLVYMQNSGLLNALNPWLSMFHAELYDIPILFIVGWRGEPGIADEPQHSVVGRLTPVVLREIGLEPFHLKEPSDTEEARLAAFLKNAVSSRRSAAVLVSKGVLDGARTPLRSQDAEAPFPKMEAISCILGNVGSDDFVVAGIGHTGREVLKVRKESGQEMDGERDLLAIGGMGFASMLALQAAVSGKRRVWCLDGDGALLMQIGNLALVRDFGHAPLVHIVFNNGVHASVGGEPVVGAPIALAPLARALGYESVSTASNRSEIDAELSRLRHRAGPSFLEVRVGSDPSTDLPRPGRELRRRRDRIVSYLSA